MIARVVLGYVLAVLAFIPAVTRAFGAEHSYKLILLMTADLPEKQPGQRLEVYYDFGDGFQPADSAAAALEAGRREYELPLPTGSYKQFRIDPASVAGRFTIERIAIRRPDGSTQPIPLTDVSPSQQLSLIERTPERLVVDSPRGSTDPRLLYVPEPPISIAVPEQNVGRLLGRLLGYWIAGVLVIVLVERIARPLAPAVARRLQSAARWSEAHPKGVVVGAAAIATLTATYPVLFLNRSLVSPNNHALTAMLYDRPPFVPGSRDLEVEDARGSDMGAMMWAFVPYSNIQREALSAREVPLWNRFNGSGRSLWGQGQTFLLDPLHWLTFSSSDWGHDLKFVAHRFVFAAGVGVAALVGSAGWLPAAVAAAAVPFLGFFTFRFNHDAAFSLTYAPWILVAWFALAAARTRSEMARAALLLTAASALVLVASPPKEAVVMLAGCQAAGLLALLLSVKGTRSVGHRLGFAAVAGAATLTVAAPNWLVFLDSLGRSLTAYDQPRAIFGPLQAAPQLLLGSLSPVIELPTLHITAMLLLIAALVAPWSLVRRPAILACFITAVCLIAVGFGAIPEAWLLRVPLVANIHQINVTTTTAAIVLLSVVCAAGAEALLAASPSQVYILASFTTLAAAWLLRYAGGAATDRLELWFIGLLLASVTAVPLCVQAVRRAPGRVLPIASVLSVGALLLLPGGLHVETGVAALDRLLSQPRLRADLVATSPAVDAVHQGMTEPARAVGLETALLPGSQALYDLEGIGGPDALEIGAYEELVDAAGIDRPWGPLAAGGWLTVVSTSGFERVTPLLDMLNVGFVLAPPDNVPEGLIEAPMWGPDRLKALRRPTAWPRAFSADGVTTYADAQDLLYQVATQRKPLAAVQSTDREAMEATQGMPAASGDTVPAWDYKLTANTTSFVVHTSGPGVAVLTESFLPDDFRATLNGQRVPYFRVNHAFKAVAIPSAGEWTVAFEYRPHRWDVSLAIAGVGVLLIAGLALLARKSQTADGRR